MQRIESDALFSFGVVTVQVYRTPDEARVAYAHLRVV